MTGCNKTSTVDGANASTFQSTAGPMTGCNHLPIRVAAGVQHVSIHSRPHDRLQRAWASAALPQQRVSIHSRPHDRLQPLVRPLPQGQHVGFNPQPAP